MEYASEAYGWANLHKYVDNYEGWFKTKEKEYPEKGLDFNFKIIYSFCEVKRE